MQLKFCEKEERGVYQEKEVPEDVMQKKAALLIALALNDPTNAVTRRLWTEIASIFSAFTDWILGTEIPFGG